MGWHIQPTHVALSVIHTRVFRWRVARNTKSKEKLKPFK